MHGKFSYIFILIFLFFGVISYDFVQFKTGFSYTDEILAAFMFFYWILKAKHKTKGLYLVLSIFSFYLVNSILHPNNVLPAILSDFVQQLKPFVSFFTLYDIGINLNDTYKKKICCFCKIFALLILPVGLINMGGGPIMNEFLGGYARYATISICLGTTYLLFSNQNKKDIVVTFLIYAIGLLSFRSKMFGFFAAAIAIFFFWNNIKIKKRLVNFKTMIFAVIAVSGIIWASWDKINFYFVEGFQAQNMFARPLLYAKAIEILQDYPLFGSGFGSYATDASAQYYSPLYFAYQLYLSPEIGEGLFISDTYFPVLAQFGYVGIGLFFYFWYWIIRKAKCNLDGTGDVLNFKLAVLIVIFFFIESVADSTFTQNRGLYMMAMLAVSLKTKKIHEKSFIYSK